MEKLKTFMSEIKELNIKKNNLPKNEGHNRVRSQRSTSFHSENFNKMSQPTEYNTLRNDFGMSKEQTSNDMSSNNNYEDFYQNEGELFEIWSLDMLNVYPIIAYHQHEKSKSGSESATKLKVFGNVINNIILKIGKTGAL